MPVPAHLMISPPPLKCGTEKVNKEFMLLLLEERLQVPETLMISGPP